MNSNDQLLTDFYSLNGQSLREKWRSFNSYLKSLSAISNTQQELILLINSITQRDSSEEAFKIEIMMEFKLYDHLITELKRNNLMVIRKLLKNSKLFGEIFSGVDPQVFIEDIFPYLSYPGKLKILHGIYKNVHDPVLVDKFYLTVEKEYGSGLAGNLLAGCSIDFIKLKMEKYYMKFSNRQLIFIIKKEKDFLSYYLELLKQKDSNCQLSHYHHRRAFKEFAKLHPEMFWKVNDDYHMDIQFGKRITPVMFRSRNPIVKGGGQQFLNSFSKMDRLYKVARNDGKLKEFLISLLPSTHYDFTSFNIYMEKFLKQFPPSQRSTILAEIFKIKYGVDLVDYPEYCRGCLQLIPIEFKEAIIDKLIISDENLVVYYDISKSIPLIKKRLQHSADTDTRGRLSGLLYKACSINDNRPALLDALNYVATRHKNDTVVITVFFNNLMHLADIAKLDDDAWEKIIEMHKVMELSRRDYNGTVFYGKFFSHLIEYGKPLEEYCKKRLQEVLNNCNFGGHYILLLPMPAKYERIYLEEIGKYIVDATFKDHKNYQTICISYLTVIAYFNINNGKLNPIDLNIYGQLLEQLKTNGDYGSMTTILYGIQKYPSNEFWHDLFWKQIKECRDNTTLTKYLRKWPERMGKNIDKVLDGFNLYSAKMFLNLAKRSLDEKSLDMFKNHALNMLNCGEYEKIRLAVIILSYISPKSLLELVYPLITKSDNKDISKDESILRKLAIKRLHRLGDFKKIFTLLLGYCNNPTCARYVTIPLWSIACNSPEIDLKEELIKFVDGPLRVRKLILILSKFLFKSDDFAKLLRTVNEKESDPSMKNAIFEKISEYLRENPSEFFWNSFKSSVGSIEDANKDVYTSLMEIARIPVEYLPEYIPLVFEKISANPYWDIKRKKFEFLEVIPDHVIGSLKMGFLKGIVKETAHLETVSNFHWKCVFYSQQAKQEELFEENFLALKDFILENRHSMNRMGKVRNSINNFAIRFSEVALNVKGGGDLVEKFMVKWRSIKELDQFYQSRLTIEFTDLYFKNDFDAYKMGLEMKDFLSDYIKDVGISVLPLLSDQLDKFLVASKIKERNEVGKFVLGLSEEVIDENVYGLLINLLGNNSPKAEDRSEYNGVLKSLMNCEIPAIKFSFDQYLSRGGCNDILIK